MSAPAAPHGVNGTGGTLLPYNDWPNDIGFEVFHEEKEPIELKVSGTIPAYAAGVLYRTGPGGHQLATEKNKTFSTNHWFDGFAQTHRFEILPPAKGNHITNVKYNSRHTCNGRLEKIRKYGKFNTIGFANRPDPCESFFQKVMSSFQAARGGDVTGVEDYNVSVTVNPNLPLAGSEWSSKALKGNADGSPPEIKNIWMKTDNNNMQSLNPTTLEPIEGSNDAKLHPELTGPFTGSHSRTDPVTGDWFNYNLDVKSQAVYRVFGVSAETGKAKILATISDPKIKPSYLHSIMLTEHYVVICIYNSYFSKNSLKILWTRNMLDTLEDHPENNNIWLVIDRVHDRGLVSIYETPPFFAFHPVNAWEEPSPTDPTAVDIVTDIPTYPNLDVLKRMYYANLKATAPGALHYTTADHGDSTRPTLSRFKLPSVPLPSSPNHKTLLPSTTPVPTETLYTAANFDTPELPTYNPRLDLKPTRYIYGVTDRGHSTFVDGLVKYDTHTNTATHWAQHAQSPGEAIFLPAPDDGAEEGVKVDGDEEGEDNGVLLSVVLDGTRGKSHLLCLDAKTMKEVGRAEMEGVVGFGFHGCHVPRL